MDNCVEIVPIVYNGETIVAGPCPNTYTLERTWTANDNCGNQTTSTQTITVQDTQNPVFSGVPADVTVSCENVPAVVNPSASDNCDNNPNLVYDGEVRTDGSCPDSYTLTRSWTATDECGNASTTQQVITVEDTSNPAFTFVPADVTVNCDAIPAAGTPTATDNCDSDVTINYEGENQTAGVCNDSYTLTRRWTATDNCGNSTEAIQTITVQDTTKPEFTVVPSDVTVSCESVPALGTVEATDNCDSDVSINYDGETRINGSCPNAYTLNRQWTATDNCGNNTTVVQTIVVEDNTNPVFTSVPANVTVECDAIPTVGSPAATDNCTANVNISYDGETRTDGACANNYTLTRQWTATDECGNQTTTEQIITVEDTTNPNFLFVPSDVTVSCDAIPGVGTPTADDNCTASVMIVYNGETRTDGPCANYYTLTRMWTATDECGNFVTAEQIITVQDLEAPQFQFVPADITVSCEFIPAPGNPTATDNCTASVIIGYNGETRIDGPCLDTYTLVRQWTASDECGNQSTATQTLTVRDTIAPIFLTVPTDLTVDCDAIPAVGTPEPIDNCDTDITLNYDGETRTDGSCADSYTLTRQWTAIDNCGNSSTAQQVITVQDTTPPIFLSVPTDITIDCDDVPISGVPQVTDNCDTDIEIDFIGEVRVDGNCPNNYYLERTWVASDNCGNTATAMQTLTVQDTTKPVFTFVPGDTLVNCDAVPDPGTPTASDNCTSDVDIVYNGETRTDGNCIYNYMLERSWTATDECGNSTSTVQVIMVQDTTMPVFTFIPADTLIECDVVPDPGIPTATDNCTSTVDIVYNGEVRTDGSCPSDYTLERSWIATDECGNTALAIQIIQVQDTTKPVFMFVPVDVLVDCDAIPVPGNPTATDNCTANVEIDYMGEVENTGACKDDFLLVRSWTATDECGNAVTATQAITVQDTTLPVFTFIPADTLVNCDAIPAPGSPEATDNCDNEVTIAYTGEVITDGFLPGYLHCYTQLDGHRRMRQCEYCPANARGAGYDETSL